MADGDAKEAAAQVSQDLFSLAGVLGMDDPIVLPELGRELIQQAGGARSATKLGAEDAGKGAHWDQKGGVFGRMPLGVLGVRAAGADQQMDMGMIEQSAGPSVEHGQDAGDQRPSTADRRKGAAGCGRRRARAESRSLSGESAPGRATGPAR